ncbi:uncharacterized protein N7518_010248, partial [Penicillium psychrosexuale]|uniref:uncharacterized protein n=1 Tax=Penicillium psychrosexuale TaxID=1002107 RepID=UPI002545A2B0
ILPTVEGTDWSWQFNLIKAGKTLALAAIHDVLIDLETIVWFAHLCYVNRAPLVFIQLITKLDLFLPFRSRLLLTLPPNLRP